MKLYSKTNFWNYAHFWSEWTYLLLGYYIIYILYYINFALISEKKSECNKEKRKQNQRIHESYWSGNSKCMDFNYVVFTISQLYAFFVHKDGRNITSDALNVFALCWIRIRYFYCSRMNANFSRNDFFTVIVYIFFISSPENIGSKTQITS